jgi:hypothetical protein
MRWVVLVVQQAFCFVLQNSSVLSYDKLSSAVAEQSLIGSAPCAYVLMATAVQMNGVSLGGDDLVPGACNM